MVMKDDNYDGIVTIAQFHHIVNNCLSERVETDEFVPEDFDALRGVDGDGLSGDVNVVFVDGLLENGKLGISPGVGEGGMLTHDAREGETEGVGMDGKLRHWRAPEL